MYHSFLIHSSADGHLGCLQVLAIINSAAMNIGIHVSLSIPHTYDQLIYNKRGENKQSRKDSLFNKQYWENCTATYKIMKSEHSLTPYTKINSKWIKDLNIRPKL